METYYRFSISRGPYALGIGYRVAINSTLAEYEDDKRKRTIVSSSKGFFYTGTRRNAEVAWKELNKKLHKFLKSKYELLEEDMENGIYKVAYDASEKQRMYKELEAIKLDTEPVPFEPSVLVLKEKHSTCHYLLTSPEQAARTFSDILTMRWKEKWYEWMKSRTSSKTAPGYTMLEVDALPSTMEFRKGLMKTEIQRYEKALQEEKEIHDLYERITRAVDRNNGTEAYFILQELKSGEYEGFEVIHPEIVQ